MQIRETNVNLVFLLVFSYKATSLLESRALKKLARGTGYEFRVRMIVRHFSFSNQPATAHPFGLLASL